MMEQAIIPGYLTTKQAAEASGLTAHRIGCLVRAGEVAATKVGGTLLVDASSLMRYAQANQGRGRPMDAKTAYGALWLLSGMEVDWLPYARMRRLQKRLETVSAEDLSWQLRRRAEARRYRVSESFMQQVAEQLSLSGSSATALAQMGLLPTSGRVEGYCAESALDEIVRSSFLQDDSNGNVAIHVASWLPGGVSLEMPLAVVAADLSQSLDTREREAGLAMLRRLLNEHR